MQNPTQQCLDYKQQNSLVFKGNTGKLCIYPRFCNGFLLYYRYEINTIGWRTALVVYLVGIRQCASPVL